MSWMASNLWTRKYGGMLGLTPTASRWIFNVTVSIQLDELPLPALVCPVSCISGSTLSSGVYGSWFMAVARKNGTTCNLQGFNEPTEARGTWETIYTREGGVISPAAPLPKTQFSGPYLSVMVHARTISRTRSIWHHVIGHLLWEPAHPI